MNLLISEKFEVQYIQGSVVLGGYLYHKQRQRKPGRETKANLHTFKQMIDETNFFSSIPIVNTQ